MSNFERLAVLWIYVSVGLYIIIAFLYSLIILNDVISYKSDGEGGPLDGDLIEALLLLMSRIADNFTSAIVLLIYYKLAKREEKEKDNIEEKSRKFETVDT